MAKRGGKREGAGRKFGSKQRVHIKERDIYNDLIGSFKTGKYYVYYHINKETKEVFYIGKGSNYRAWDKERGDLWQDYVSNVGEYNIKIICANMSELEAFAIESVLIKHHNPSCNIKSNPTIFVPNAI